MSKYINIVIHVFGFIILFSCSSTPPHIVSKNIVPVNVKQVFLASYDHVWNSALKELDRYSLTIINKNAGLIKTDDIEVFDESYDAFFDRSIDNVRNKIKYNIEIRITPLKKEGTYSRTEVSIIKYVVKLNELGSEKAINSDLTEENTILYRIKRLLEIERSKIERTRNL